MFNKPKAFNESKVQFWKIGSFGYPFFGLKGNQEFEFDAENI